MNQLTAHNRFLGPPSKWGIRRWDAFGRWRHEQLSHKLGSCHAAAHCLRGIADLLNGWKCEVFLIRSTGSHQTALIMPSECCVPLCTNRGGHLFPWRDQKRVNTWMIAIKRGVHHCPGKVWKPTKYAVVCRDHFDDGDYKPSTHYGW